MSPFWLQALNIAFLVFHTGLIVFNCVGWAWRRTRPWNLLTLGLTAASWLLMGLRYGIGYCVCTDWHWQVRKALGYRDPERTYVQFLVRAVTGCTPSEELAKGVAGWVFGVAVVLSVGLNLRDRSQATPRLSDA